MKLKLIFIGTFLLCLLIVLFGCSSRKVHTELTRSTDKTETTTKHNSFTLNTDHSKVNTDTKQQITDSSSFEIEITPDSGIVDVAKGDFKGHAKKIIIKGSDYMQEFFNQLMERENDIQTAAQVQDVIDQKMNITETKKIKDSDKEPSSKPWIALVITIGVLIAAGMIYIKFLK
jgi:flagellar basal body-associated protein FliL